MASLTSAAGRAVRAASPRHRRWRRLLDSCLLDPSFLPEPVTEPGPRDVIICGAPHSGTTLLAASLHQPPAMAAVMEPWDGLRLEPDLLFSSLRRELASGSLGRGRLDLGRLAAAGEVAWQRDGERPHDVTVADDTLVGVAWPTYWQYLPLLPTTRFLVCVRHPADVLAAMAADGGRLAEGYDYDVEFNGRLNAELEMVDLVDDRQLALYDRVNGTVLDHIDRPTVFVVHYERWFDEPATLLAEISHFLGIDLRSDTVALERPAAADRRGELIARSRTARRLGYLE